MVIEQIGRQNNIITFQSREENKKLSIKTLSDEELYLLANTPDKFIQAGANSEEAKKFLQSPMRNVEKKSSQAIPVFDTLLSMALTPGDMGDKIFAGIGRALEWGIFIGITDKLNESLMKNKNYKSFSEKHPAAASLVGSIAVSAVGIAGYTAVRLGLNKIIDKYKPLKDCKEAIYGDLNKNKLGQKIAKYVDKHRNKTALAGLIGIAAFIGIAINGLFSLSKMKKNANAKTEDYKNLRLQASRELNNRLISRQEDN